MQSHACPGPTLGQMYSHVDRPRKVDEEQVDVPVPLAAEHAEHLQVVVGALDRRLEADGPRALGGDLRETYQRNRPRRVGGIKLNRACMRFLSFFPNVQVLINNEVVIADVGNPRNFHHYCMKIN